MNSYPHIFTPGRVGNLTLKNRIVMAPMGTMLSSAGGEITEDFIAYYAARAKGGVGLIVTEVTPVDYVTGRGGPTGPRADHIKYQCGWQRLAEAVHPYGAKLFAQLQHPGNQSMELFNDGNKLVSPSGVKSLAESDTPRAMTTEEVREMVQKFVRAAVILKGAGLDGVEIHGAHGYLINQFFSPHTNRRIDEYGGSFENRMRFGAEIVTGIRESCGRNFAISIRLTLDEHTGYGFHLDEGVKIAKYFADLGIDMISASNGTYESMETNLESSRYAQGWRVYLAEAVKQVVDIPVVGVGNLREPQVIEDIIAAGKCDFAAIGRGLVAEPNWVEKVRAGREVELLKCISCCHCFSELVRNHVVTCALNPEKGHEFEYGPLQLTGSGRKVVVVGGGPGGIEVARVLALRQFNVVLMERSNQLGGQVVAASKPIGKEITRWYIDYGEVMMRKLNVEVRLNYTATSESIAAEKPYAVFIATGGQPLIPNIKGVYFPHVMTAEQYLLGKPDLAGKKVAVVGGGMTGCETAVTIAARGSEVSIVEMADEICGNAFIVNRISIMQEIGHYGIQLLPGHKLQEICEDSLVLQCRNHEAITITADYVVLSLGVKPVNNLYDQTLEVFSNTFLVGDAVKTGTIADATHSAHVLARGLD